LLENRSPFESLRANSEKLKMIERFPFMLSLSKHSEALFSNLLSLFRTRCSSAVY